MCALNSKSVQFSAFWCGIQYRNLHNNRVRKENGMHFHYLKCITNSKSAPHPISFSQTIIVPTPISHKKADSCALSLFKMHLLLSYVWSFSNYILDYARWNLQSSTYDLNHRLMISIINWIIISIIDSWSQLLSFDPHHWLTISIDQLSQSVIETIGLVRS